MKNVSSNKSMSFSLMKSRSFATKNSSMKFIDNSLSTLIPPIRTSNTKRHNKNVSVSSISALQRSSSTNFTSNGSMIKIAFGKIVPKEKVKLKTQLTNQTESRLHENKSNNCNKRSINASLRRDVINVFKKGIGKKQKELIIGTDEEFYKSKRKDKNFYNKGFPIIAPKKIMKNILPKEYDFNRIKTPEEVLRNAYHPVVRYQKGLLSKHINSINQEINVNYSTNFWLINKDKFSEQFRMCQDLIDLEKDTKLIEMISELINNNFKLGNEIDEVLEAKKRQEEYERKQKVLLRFKQVLIRAAIHFKRLNIDLDDFLAKNSKTIQPFEEESSFNLICAIKDRDIDSVKRILNHNKLVLFDFDHVYLYITIYSLNRLLCIGQQKETYIKLYH